MQKPAPDQPRIALLEAAVGRVSNGNRTAFGKKLGYKDGAFVRQMLSGLRPVTEKTIRQIEALDGMAGWFSAAPGVPADVAQGVDRATPSPHAPRTALLAASLQVIGDALAGASDSTRADVLKLLDLYLHNPASNIDQVPIIARRLSGEFAPSQDRHNPSKKAA